MPDQLQIQSMNFERIKDAIEFLETNFKNQPGLDEIAASVHLSKFHFQRIFKEWAGVTPSQFLHFLTIEYAKEQLRKSHSVFDTSLQAGLSSASRLHDLFITFEAVTPGDYRRLGENLLIRYGFHPTPFGECLLASTDRGICALRFLYPAKRKQLLEELKAEWPLAELLEKPQETGVYVQRIFTNIDDNKEKRVHLYLKGTNFQIQVWQALLALQPGDIVAYQNVAEYLTRPTAVRAVGNVIAKNPVGYLIPCHRVIRKTGQVHGYRWSSARKRAILGWEASQVHV